MSDDWPLEGPATSEKLDICKPRCTKMRVAYNQCAAWRSWALRVGIERDRSELCNLGKSGAYEMACWWLPFFLIVAGDCYRGDWLRFAEMEGVNSRGREMKGYQASVLMSDGHQTAVSKGTSAARLAAELQRST